MWDSCRFWSEAVFAWCNHIHVAFVSTTSYYKILHQCSLSCSLSTQRIMKTFALAGLMAASASAQSIVDVAVGEPTLSTLTSLLVQANLVDTLAGTNPNSVDGAFTVFAPTDEAFGGLLGALEVGQSAFLLDPTAGVDALTSTLLYHVANGASAQTSSTFPTLSGETVDFQGESVNGFRVLTNVTGLDNGDVFIIDGVLTNDAIVGALPSLNIVETAVSVDSLSTLVDLVVAAGLADVLAADNDGNGFTVFAPTNEAFSALFAALEVGQSAFLADPTGIDALTATLLYHVVPSIAYSSALTNGASIATLSGQTVSIDLSEGVAVNDANVALADVATTNGVVHVVDGVLVNDEIVAALPSLNIVETAISVPELSTLVELVVRLNLQDVLASDNSGAGFTVFAPTNDAFAAIPNIDEIDDATLTDILLYHVVGAGIAYSSSLTDGQAIPTLTEENVVVDLSEGVRINDSDVVIADVATTNGVVHVIDEVLFPPITDPNICVPAGHGLSLPGITEAWCTENCKDGAGDLAPACDPNAGFFLCRC